MSFAGPNFSTAQGRAVNNAWDNRAVMVAAVGNDGSSDTQYYPAAYPKVIAVAGTNRDDSLRPSSNTGDWVDVAAPGTSILSMVPLTEDCDGNGSADNLNYYSKSGTTMATPHVSGLAGLMFSKDGEPGPGP